MSMGWDVCVTVCQSPGCVGEDGACDIVVAGSGCACGDVEGDHEGDVGGDDEGVSVCQPPG